MLPKAKNSEERKKSLKQDNKFTMKKALLLLFTTAQVVQIFPDADLSKMPIPLTRMLSKRQR